MIEAVGHKYNWNLLHDGVATTATLTDEQRKAGQLVHEDRPFFCSELIAKCLE
jgi:hypothetical protein